MKQQTHFRDVIFLRGTPFLPPGPLGLAPIALLPRSPASQFSPGLAPRAFDINTVGLFYEITVRFPRKLLIAT